VVSHVHPDHTYGLAGYLSAPQRPQIIMTDATRRLFLERQLSDDSRTRQGKGLVAIGGPYALPDAVIMPGAEPTTLDLGGRVVKLVERVGHTPSDLTIEIDSPRVIWTGDLVFHGMFPYYGDARPIQLRETCRAMLADTKATFVPGHGACAAAGDLGPYLELIDHVEQAARVAFAAGKSAADGAKDYKLPESQKDLYIFNPQVFVFAFEAWYRQLRDAPKQ
jgi:glyoxylase-like metal-dependent hydrolase (beta-lactamase superfamily II)